MNKIINIFTLLFVLAAACFTQSCSDNDKVTASRLNIFRGDEEISQMEFNIGSAFTMIGVDCDADWTANCDADWVTLSNHAGYGYDNKKSYVKVSVAKNEGTARTTNVVFASGSVSKVLVINQKSASADPGDTFQTSFEFVEAITRGYNLGNTLDCDPETGGWFNPTSDLDWETVWGQPKTTQEIIDSIAAKGFDIIRVPVTWFPHMDSDGNINETWMARVEEVVGYVLNAGCYCILNSQHDNGASNGRTDGAAWVKADMDAYEETAPKFRKMWTQIANRFKDKDEHLLFEAFNEILDASDNWGDPSDENAYAAANKLAEDFVEVVRATGGNNEYRNLIVNPYSAGTTAAKLAGFQVPQNDIHSNHLLASVHSYDPYNFCNDNGEWNIYVWDSSCEQEIDDLTARVNNRFNDLGIPYIFGEFGAIDENKEMSERIKYTKYVVAKFRQYDTKGLWWMGLFDRKKLEWYEPEIVDAIISGSTD